MKPSVLLLTCATCVVAALARPARSDEPAAPSPEQASPDTLRRIVTLPEIVVSTARAGDRAPLARSTLGRDALRSVNFGQDTPMALATLPGAYAYSDAGNGIGYSYLSIRGFPQRRISVLINDVPLNDPESHEVYWIDHPDLLASTTQAQVQRGVGSALYGAASLGGSVSLETGPFSDTPQAAASISYGTWETKRLMLEMNSGRLAGGWNFYGRYSRIETFGYRDQSWSRLWSYALSARKLASRHSVRVNLYGGPEETHLAYLGVPTAYLEGQITGNPDRDRRFNPITYANERDHFFEPHYELVHSWSPREGLTLSQTLFYFDGKGYYDEQRFDVPIADYRLSPWATYDPTLFGADSLLYYRDADGNGVLDRDAQDRVTLERFDLVRRRTIANRHYGWVPRVRLEHPGGALTVGGEIRAHDGRHWGEVISANGLPPGTESNHLYYDYHPRTLATGMFMREEWQPSARVLVTGDVAWRHQGYFMRGDRFGGVRFDQPYDFALPRLGVTYAPRGDVSVFASWAYARREPAFRDLYDAESNGNVPLLKNGKPLIRPEKVNDYELGGSLQNFRVQLTANLFRMDFRDELVYAGQFNTDLGYPILGNAAKSVHQGVELAGHAVLGAGRAEPWPIGGRDAESARSVRAPRGVELDLDANATLSDNHFVEYREYSDYSTSPPGLVRYDGNKLGFFPGVIANLGARARWRHATLGVQAQHAGRIYLDSNENILASIGPRTVLNASAGYRFRGAGAPVEALVRVFNVANTKYATSGYMDYDAAGNPTIPTFIPAATRSVLASVRVEF